MTKTKNDYRWLALVAYALTSISPVHGGAPITAVAEAPTTTDNGWWFRAAPYGWLTAVNGDVAVGPLTAPVDISISDVLDSLDMTFMGAFQLGYNRWALGVDVVYAELSKTIDVHGRLLDSLRLKQTELLLTPTISYLLIANKSCQLSLYAGARIAAFDVDLTARLVRGGEVTRSSETSWADPLIGVRGQLTLSDRWAFRYLADVGGFGVSSDLIWNLFGGVGYDVSDSLGLVVGYRALAFDYTKGKVTADLITHGPIVGFEVRF